MKDPQSRIRDTRQYIKLPLIYDCWYVAGATNEFGREPVGRTLLEKSIVFYRTQAGGLVALQNRCLHRSYPLSESQLKGDNVVCGYHGIEYSPDGEILKIPCQAQLSQRKLRKYPVEEVGPFVFVWMGDADKADLSKLPELPYLVNPEGTSFHGSKFVEGNYLLLQENLNDLTHFNFLHANTFGAAIDSLDDSFLERPVEFEERNGVMGCFRVDEKADRVRLSLTPDQHSEVGDRNVHSRTGGVTHSPGVWLGENFIYVDDSAPEHPSVYKTHINHYLTPKDQKSFHYWYSVTSNFSRGPAGSQAPLENLFSAGFDEDVVAINHMQVLLDDDTTEFNEISLSGDMAGMRLRAKVLEWVEQEHRREEN